MRPLEISSKCRCLPGPLARPSVSASERGARLIFPARGGYIRGMKLSCVSVVVLIAAAMPAQLHAQKGGAPKPGSYTDWNDVDQVKIVQPFQRAAIVVQVVRLPPDRLLPVEAEPGQVLPQRRVEL